MEEGGAAAASIASATRRLTTAAALFSYEFLEPSRVNEDAEMASTVAECPSRNRRGPLLPQRGLFRRRAPGPIAQSFKADFPVPMLDARALRASAL